MLLQLRINEGFLSFRVEFKMHRTLFLGALPRFTSGRYLPPRRGAKGAISLATVTRASHKSTINRLLLRSISGAQALAGAPDIPVETSSIIKFWIARTALVRSQPSISFRICFVTECRRGDDPRSISSRSAQESHRIRVSLINIRIKRKEGVDI